METTETTETGLEPSELDEGSPPLEITDPMMTAQQLLDTMDGDQTAETQTVEYEPITPVTGSPTNFEGVMILGSQPLFTSEALITLMSHQETVGACGENRSETSTLISHQESVGTCAQTGGETLIAPLQGETAALGPGGETGAHAGGETGALGGETPGPSGGETGAQAGGETEVPVGETGVPGGETGTLGGGGTGVPGGETGTPQGGETGVTAGGETGAPAVSSETAAQTVGQPRTEPSSSSSHSPEGMGMMMMMDTSASVRGSQPGPSPAGGLKKLEKVGWPLPRRYFPGKRPLDPLKMDMSKPVVMPLSSSQMSLQCLECHIIFSDSKSMERHLKLNHPAQYEQCILREALFACYVCDRHFTNSTELMVHQKAHVEKKPFKCPICSQAYKKSSELTLHKKVHFGEDGYACADCGKPCKTLTLLKYHRRTHTGETPYVCRECGARFSQTKALQRHQLSHSSEEAEEPEPQQQQQQPKSKAIKYPCSMCKAVFRTAKGRCRHAKAKHGVSPPPSPAAENGLVPQAGKAQGVPTITAISICQPSLLQMESMGPLQRVDSNIDTTLICKLIESMGNVHRVNQVVVLGQVPPQAPSPPNTRGEEEEAPLVRGESADASVTPSPQVTEVSVAVGPCDSLLEHTIILEPITPDGQLINPPFAHHAEPAAPLVDINGLTLVPEPTERRSAGELMLRLLEQTPDAADSVSLEAMGRMVCEGEEAADLTRHDPEQTVILELTSVLTPTAEFERNRPEPTSLIPTDELEGGHQTGVGGPEERRLSSPPLVHAVQLDLEQQDLSTAAFMTVETPDLLAGESQTNPEAETLPPNLAVEFQTNPETKTLNTVSQMQMARIDHVDPVKESAPLEEEELHEINQVEPSGKPRLASGGRQKQSHELSTVEAEKGETQTPSQTEAKRAEQASDSPVNVMSAQELVKVRKRKTQLAGPMYNDYYWLSEQPIKRQRAKKSVLVVKFGPKKKEKRNKGQRKSSQVCQSTGEEPFLDTPPKPPGKKAALKKKGGKTKKAPKHDSQLEQIEEDSRAKNLKRQKHLISEDKTAQISEQETTRTPVAKKNNRKQQKALQNYLIGEEDNMAPISPEQSMDTPVVKKKKQQQKKVLQKDLAIESEMDQITSQESTEYPAGKKKKQPKNMEKELINEGTADEPSQEENADTPMIKKKKQQKATVQKDVTSDGTTDQMIQGESAGTVVVKKQQKKTTQARKTTDGKLKRNSPKGKVQNEEEKETADELSGEENTDTPVVKNTTKKERSVVSAAEQQIKQDALLLLRGHKQPQLKVYKLDPLRAACTSPPDTPLQDPLTDPLETNAQTHQPPDGLAVPGRAKGKGGRPKKNHKRLTLLASRPATASPPVAEAPAAAKPKAARKRKNPNVETEGVITSRHPHPTLQCKDCGEKFAEVSTLQGHKAAMHAVESPGLTYTNGNVFEGVLSSSHMHLCPAPAVTGGGASVMNAAATDWDMEAEAGDVSAGGDVSFPDLNVSPSLPVPCAEGSGGHPLARVAQGPPRCLTPPPALSKPDQIQTPGSDRQSPLRLTSGVSALKKGKTERLNSGRGGPEESLPVRAPPPEPPEVQVGPVTDEDIKEDLLLEVDLVTVGDQNEREEEDGCSKNESVGGPCGDPENRSSSAPLAASSSARRCEDEKATEMHSTSQTSSSCSMRQQPDVKEEEEETPVQQQRVEAMRGAGRRGGATRGRRGGGGRLKRSAATARRRSADGDAARGSEQEKSSVECQVVYQQYPLDADSQMKDEGEATAALVRPDVEPQAPAPPEVRGHVVQPDRNVLKPSSVPPPPPPPRAPHPPLEQAAEDQQVVFELESVTTSVEEQEVREADQSQSPGIVLERFLTSRHRNLHTQQEDVDAEDEEEGQVTKMKTEMQSDGSRDHGDSQRSVLVKQENHPLPPPPPAPPASQQAAGRQHTLWRVEDMERPDPSGAEAESGPSRTSAVNTELTDLTDLGSRQCIFYPVKEEEREVLLEATDGNATRHIDHRSATDDDVYDGSPEVEEYEESGLSGGSVNHYDNMEEGEADGEWQSAPQLRDFLLQSSDEEEEDGEEVCQLTSDPQPDQEAQTMASYYNNNNHSSSPQQPHDRSHSTATSAGQFHSREPIDYFSRYFGRDTWVEIAQCTNRLSKLPSHPTTAKEVAQFVGIHIAMGTLKFPSLKLYWQDFTRVPLVADAMPLSRFLQLSRKLRLASKAPANDQRPTAAAGCRNSGIRAPNPLRDDEQGNGNEAGNNDPDSSSFVVAPEPDPLWKVRAVLGRFQAACRQLRSETHYGVDQYRVPLTAGKAYDGRLRLHSTVLVGPGGLIQRLELRPDLSDKEATVESLAPKGCMVFLCKQELSTPAMLERLLVSGVHCAGRVGGGAREGHIGDEFVSSDGRLMLRRAQRGFILSTAGNGHPSMAALLRRFHKAQRWARLNRDLQSLYRIPVTTSSTSSPACCWPQVVLWYLVDLALVNAWLQYRQEQQDGAEPLSFMAFRLEVSKTLILSKSGSITATDAQDAVPPRRPPPPPQKAHQKASSDRSPIVADPPPARGSSSLPDAATRYDGSGHWPEQLGEGEEGGRCRFGGCERTSRVMCLKCCVFLCISRHHNCFLNFHSRGAS